MSGPNEPIYQRDGYRCVRCGHRAESTQHRIHGNRKDRRTSNLLSVCGDGNRGCHGWMESFREAAAQHGWECSKFAPGGGLTDTSAAPVWMPYGLLGVGWYLLDDACGMPTLCDPQPDPPHLF